VAGLATPNSAGGNGFVLFGVQQLPAGRSAILAYTMPIWSVLISLPLLHEPLSMRKIVGMTLGIMPVTGLPLGVGWRVWAAHFSGSQ